MQLKLFTSFAVFISALVSLQAAPFAVFNHKIFFAPGQGHVVETYLDIQGRSVVLKEMEDGLLRGQVEITIIFRQDEKIIAFDKKVLESPAMQKGEYIDFLDVQRFAMPHGEYGVEVTIRDLYNQENSTSEINTRIEIEEPAGSVYFSDIQLISAYKKTTETNIYSKSGYDLIPMVSDDMLNAEMSEVMLYCELYGTQHLGDGEMFLLVVQIENLKKQGAVVETTRRLERRKVAEVSPYLGKLSLQDVRTGEYTIAIEARSKNNELLARVTHDVNRLAPPLVADTTEVLDPVVVAASWVGRFDNKFDLIEHIRSLRPISDDKEVFTAENTLSKANEIDLYMYQQYFYSFWQSRDPDDPEGAWMSYSEKVQFVEKQFGTRNKRGYATDRGRVYLRYGPPVDIVDRANEPSSYPYQIWRYYKADKWNNVRFVFYDPKLTLVDYELLHCDYIPGELFTPQWRVMLQQRTTPVIGVDDRSTQPTYGSRVDDFYDNPR